MTEPATWTVAPNEGLLPIRFGMSSEAVASLPQLGAPHRIMPNGPDQKTEFRSFAHPSVSYQDNKVFYIAVGKHVSPVLFRDLDVFASPPRDSLQAFETANGQPGFLQLGFLIFENLNLSLEGFYLEHEDAYFDPASEDQDDRMVILHAPGTREHFDDLPRVTLTLF